MKARRVPKNNLRTSPCQEACPAHVDVPRYIRCIKEGKFEEALAVIREKIPFPSVCGYACYSPCEAVCGNRQFGEPIAIKSLKRTAAEKGGELWKKNLKPAPATGKKAAVVGSGPSGLTAAYYLAVLGHDVTVFETEEVFGGMLRMGIPAYRLPRETLDREIEELRKLKVAFKGGASVDSPEKLFERGFDAVYLACGAQRGARLGIPGEEAPGVQDGISFLKRVNKGEKVAVGRRVAVIGGGNTAVDAARSAIRLGAEKVAVKYRRTEAEMTAYEEEVGSAVFEGISFDYLLAPVRIAPEKGALSVTFIRMELGKADATGRPAPVPVTGSEFAEAYDTVITAVGQRPDIPVSFGPAVSDRGFLRVDSETLALKASKKGVFAGGDLVTGPASIIQAIAQGRKAASSIDRYLGGSGLIDRPLAPPEEEVVVMEYQAGDSSRVSVPCIPIGDRMESFAAVEESLTGEMAMKEARRCRSCDARVFEVVVHGEGCKDCSYCVEVCGMGVFDHEEGFNKRGYRPLAAKHPEKCVGCMACFYACPDFSIDVREAASK